MQEIRIQSLGWEDTLEKKVATHFNFFSWSVAKSDLTRQAL